jgi:DNA repair ATPase RecN
MTVFSSALGAYASMKNLSRNSSTVSTIALQGYQQGTLRAELESRKQQCERLYEELEQTSLHNDQLRRDAEAASQQMRREKKKNEGLLQRLMDAIRSRNSMRGRLGNMTAQRNRALRQVETMAAQNQEVFQQLKLTTDKLGEAYQRMNAIQSEYDHDMTELADAYREVPLELRQALPAKLQALLDQIDVNYRDEQPVEPES